MTRAFACKCAGKSRRCIIPQKIVVTGPGAIGCLFAAVLSEAGHDVTLLDHRPARALLITNQGVTIQTGKSTRRVLIPATANAHTIGIADFVFLCIKSNDTLAAVSRTAPA
ncbi:MAG: 2-dehydropantoate 2-reductase N-terminal domain-containing protein, partial [bacterium]